MEVDAAIQDERAVNLISTQVTTTRKIFSVLLSIFLKGHELPLMGWGGVALASAGILAEASSKRH